MGECITTEVAPFKKTVWFGSHDISGAAWDTGNATLDRMFSELYDEESSGDLKPGTDFNGWIVPDPTWDRFGKMPCNYFFKGDQKVYYLNEDRYSSVGEITHTFFSDQLNSLEEFLRDWGFDIQDIEENRPVISFS